MAKTTLELPDDVMRAARIRAATEGRRLKDVVADLLRRGLEAPPEAAEATPRRVRLPLIHCAHGAAPGMEITPERVAELLMAEEAEGRTG